MKAVSDGLASVVHFQLRMQTVTRLRSLGLIPKHRFLTLSEREIFAVCAI